ncbi:MAG: DUF92 domain-containing protein [Roseiflexus sp.]|jgi:uncharacterized protein (TIGR00297 family)|uniref:DUF92 domain-containing protein n=1 Tax=Roseiflexus sp. TaxID=2562120 RepID=UPI0025F04876|nr:DUF92 domain-containing protein [Roseiflexus sp.]MCL6540002.1 DUF92 domain-containing protein [Roseiflexus sp.]
MMDGVSILPSVVMVDIPRIAAGLVLSAFIGAVAYRRHSLDRSGWLGAIITGTATFGLGGWTWGSVLIVFFVTSSALSHFRQAQKQRIAGEKFEKGGRRDLWQALANGGAGAALALVYGLTGEPVMLLAAYVGVMATVTADTWATEIGVLSPHPPRLITSGRIVAPGTSGGVTLYGISASAGGALLIGATTLLFMVAERGVWLVALLPAALVGGVVGSLVDSLLGATVQAMYLSPTGETEKRASRDGVRYPLLRGWRWMNNDMVNFLSSLAGGAAAFGVYALTSGG